MAYLMPVVLLTWMLTIFALFYYHDKTVIIGAAYESAVVGSESYAKEEQVEEDVVIRYFQKRVKGKLLFFSRVAAQMQLEKDRIVITASCKKRGMSVSVTQSAACSYPEQEIRKVKRIKEGLEDLNE